MNLKVVAASLLKPAPWNPRIVYEEEFRQLKQGIKDDPDFLQERPILATRDGTIYAGNMRYRALLALYDDGWESPWGAGRLVPVSIRDIPEHVAKARAVRDNVHAGNWQEIELGQLLTEIAAEANGEALLPNLGLRDDELRNVMAAAGIGEAVDPFTMREQKPEGLPGDAPGTSGASDGEAGPERQREPLTILLRFSDALLLTDALFRMKLDSWRRIVGYTEIHGYDERGGEYEF